MHNGAEHRNHVINIAIKHSTKTVDKTSDYKIHVNINTQTYMSVINLGMLPLSEMLSYQSLLIG